MLKAAPDLAAVDLGLEVHRAHGLLGDNQIAGILDRPAKTISIATKFSFPSQQFTFAHELGHFMLHPGQTYFRDREMNAPRDGEREYFETEADAFAAEFLMPRHYLQDVFCEMFGGPIDGRVPHVELAAGVSAGKPPHQRWTAVTLADATPMDRAGAIAIAHTFTGRFFSSLTQQFGVSRKAMAIQLLQTGLVR